MPGATVASVAAIIVSRPLDVRLQERYTVDGDPRDLEVESVQPIAPSPITRLFQLLLTGGNPDMRAKAYFVLRDVASREPKANDERRVTNDE